MHDIVDRCFQIDFAIFIPDPDRPAHIQEMVKKNQADSIIHSGPYFRRSCLMEAVARALKGIDVSAPQINTAAYNMENTGRIKTRADAFVQCTNKQQHTIQEGMMKKVTFITVFAALCAFLAAGSIQASELDRFIGMKGKIDIAGGTAHIPVMNDAGKNIMKFNPDIRITVAGGGSGVGVQKVGEGLVDIGNTGRAVSEAEKSKYGLVSFPFAIDGVAVVVNPKNQVKELATEQIQKIFSGQVVNWKDVGGADAPIHLFTRDEASGTREVFWEKLLNKGDVAQSANIVASNGAMKVAVAGDPHAIGYLGIGHISKDVKAIVIDKVEPLQENAKSGVYRVTRNLYMNTKGQPTQLQQAFIDYILGPDGAEICKKYGYIPISE
ncbi:Phosphate ABC transporter, periplasmic phosphate-binding protein PstS (TC 3.A.1.7.1) [anaerobic digester metagenome]|uniref:Phosphate ABC transporter, periplasmic phosphate-binding protein PstS (TC 3.A.1.7.1) n=1 Tax=anaerobic digester metagenome TaxID=1263854 RepID=A0A485MBX2_9ZZZZ